VKPTRSQNSTETWRSSVVEPDENDAGLVGGAAGEFASKGGAAAGAVATAAPTDAPQYPQKRLPGGISAPQDAHGAARGAPQLPQNRIPSGFSPEHAWQRKIPTSCRFTRKITTRQHRTQEVQRRPRPAPMRRAQRQFSSSEAALELARTYLSIGQARVPRSRVFGLPQ
jgi:hypothetical protein